MAASTAGPVWIARRAGTRTEHVVSEPPDELRPDETLRDQLTAGRFIRLLPIIEFLRAVCRDELWHDAPIRATIVVDDPNLHWMSYGRLSFANLIKHALDIHYHIAIATVPLDMWYADRRAVALFQRHRRLLSLTIHGDCHTRQELGRTTSRLDARRVLAGALVRTRRFEQRTGLSVDRVMVPPHEACSLDAFAEMDRLGYEALCATRPYPWVPHENLRSAFATPSGAPALGGWGPAETETRGFPVIIRRFLGDDPGDVALRAYLGQPVVLYAHVSDFDQGLDVLHAPVSAINRLPGARWCSLGQIARSNFQVRRDGAALIVRAFSRRVSIPLSEGVDSIRVESGYTGERARIGVLGGRQDGVTVGDGEVRLSAGTRAPASIELGLRPTEPIDPASITPRRPQPGAILRRVATELRDRTSPYARRR